MKHKLFFTCFGLLFLMLCLRLPAQQKTDYVIEGTVYDEAGQPFEGVTLYIKDKVTFGTISNSQGKFSIKAARGNTIVFSFVGYTEVEYLVAEEKRDVEIRLAPAAEEMDEVIVTALGSQRKISALAAVTSVDVKDLQVPAPSITNMLGGRVAGIISMQYSGEPGKNLAEFWVRGIGTFGANSSALVLIDGLEGDLNSIDPADVESFSVLKDASATAVYGVRGANGVVIVTTKRGVEGKLNIMGRVNFSVSQIRRLPKYLRAYEYAKLVNEAHVARNEDPRYTENELEIIQDGLDPDLYPDVSWQKEIIEPVSFKKSYFASVDGGGSIARYYASLGMANETGAYKYERENPYASNAGYKTFSFRMNLDINLTKTTTMYFGTDAFMSINSLPGQANTDYIWQAQTRLTPLMFPIRYSTGQLSAGSQSLETVSPYVLINHTGKHTDQNTKHLLTMSISQDLSAILEGLKIRVQGAYNRDSSLSESRSAMPALYRAERQRDSRGRLVIKEIMKEQKVYYSFGHQAYRKYHFESMLNYDHLFGKDHRVSGLVYYYMSDQQNTNDLHSGESLSGIPVRYQGLSSRLTYGFRDTYMIDLNFGYTGSENFMPGKQFGFFPSIALGWAPSSYQWVKDKLKWVSFFKIRGSYGTVGNDRISSDRFPYLTRISTGRGNPWGVIEGSETVNISTMGADNLVWEKAIKSDIGLDSKFWNNKIELTVDFFDDRRDGIFQKRVQIPDYIGLVSNPYGNVGKMRSWGSDGNVSFTHEINKNMSFTLRGNYTYAQNLVENWEDYKQTYPYKESTGMPHEVVRGYQSLGFFTSEEDIRYSPSQTYFGGTLMPGDLKYKDMNGDGLINADDQVPLSYKSMYPMLMYGFGGEFRYKNLSLGILLKGTGKIDYFRNGYGYTPLVDGEYGNILEQFSNPASRWIPMDYALDNGIDPALAENPNASIPMLQYGNNNNNSQTSDFWKGDARYLRLQEVTINYTLNNNFLKKLGIASIDLQFVGNNLYVWDKVKVFDPEQADKRGAVYPIPAVYSLQVYIRL